MYQTQCGASSILVPVNPAPPDVHLPMQGDISELRRLQAEAWTWKRLADVAGCSRQMVMRRCS